MSFTSNLRKSFPEYSQYSLKNNFRDLGMNHYYYISSLTSQRLNIINFYFIIPPQPKPIDVQVITHHMQRYAVWFGGSMLASTVSISNIHTLQFINSYHFCHDSQLCKHWLCQVNKITNIHLYLSTAWVLPGVPHQKGLRRDRAEYLPPQPRVRSHVLTLDLHSLTSGGSRGGGMDLGDVKDGLKRWWGTVVALCFFFFFLIACSASDVWDEKGDPEYEKNRDQKKTQTGWRIYCECFLISFSSRNFFFVSKWGKSGL